LRILLIDGDLYAFASCIANEFEADWGDGLITIQGDLNAAKAMFDSRIRQCEEELEADRVIIALSDPLPGRWREGIMPEYKANRTGRKPVGYMALRDYIHERYHVHEKEGLEGDDVLGILMTHPEFHPEDEKIIISIDKDMLTIPGNHLNYDKVERGKWEEGIRWVSEEEANYHFLTQAITGDRTDGYPGCPGVGPVKAEKILGDIRGYPYQMWQRIVGAYEAKGLNEETAILNARVARILQWQDYKDEKVILWNPPSATTVAPN